MKKFFTLFAAVLMAGSMMASNITYHLTGCIADEFNPTEFSGDDDFYFFPQDGYLISGWEVTVKHGETIIANNDFGNSNGYVDVRPGYLNVVWNGTVTEDIDVTIVCPSNTVSETIALEAYEEGIHVTTSVPNMKWLFDIKPVSQVADSAAMDAILTETIASYNYAFPRSTYRMFGSCGYLNSDYLNNSILFSEYHVAQRLPESGDYYCFAVGVIDDGGYVARGTNVAILQFTYEETPTALSNNAAAVKAVKTIENGQMIIIRDGKKFNAVGTQL